MKKYLDLIINIGFLFILNITLTWTIYHDIEFLNIIFYLLEALFFGSLIKLIANLFQKQFLRRFINLAILVLITIIYASQFVYYSFYESFYSVYSLFHGSQVFGFLEAILKVIFENIYGFSFFMILLVVIVVVYLKVPLENFKKKNSIAIGITVLSLCINLLLANVLTSGLYSYHNLLHNTHNVALNVKKFGLLTSTFIDAKRYIFGFEPSLINENSNNSKEYTSKDYNITDINFTKIIEKEEDVNIKDLSKYLEEKTPTKKNDYTGIFQGKNLIFITAESFDFSLIDKNLTPTLYKMQNEGLNFTNFYTPIYYASTSDGEYINLTGLLPEERTWSYVASLKNYYPYSYSNIFNSLGYKTFAYHNGKYDFYNRNEVLKSLNYSSYKGCGNGLENYINCDLWPQSDDEMLRETFKDYQDEDNFMVYYMTISGHLSHNFNTNDIAKKWQKETRNLKYSSNVKAYLSANIDLDKGLESLLKNLEENDLLQDTVIVLTPDHFPYGLNNTELKEIKNFKNSYDKHKSGLIIYNPNLESKEINKYAANIDILPTLLNMFGIDYDSRLIIGNDIMSDSEGIVIFNDRSFLTKEGFYNAKTNTFSNKKIAKDYLKEKQIEVYNKVNASSIMLNSDYYKRIVND